MASATDVAVPGSRRWWLPDTARQWAVFGATVLLVLGPLVPIGIAALRDRPLYEEAGSATLGNFRRLLADQDFWSAALNSLEFAVITTVISLTVGVGLAVLVSRTDLPGRQVLGGLVIAPLLLPSLALSLGWVTMYSPSGFITLWVEGVIGVTPWNLNSVPGMAVVASAVAAPVTYLFARGALSGLDSSLEDAARSAGAGPLTVLRTVTLPLLRPASLSAAVIVVTLAIEALGIPLLFGTSENIETLSSYLYNEWLTETPADQGLVSAGGAIVLLVVTVLLVLRNRFVGDADRFVTTTGKPRASRPLALGRLRWPLAVLAMSYVLLTLVAPVVGLVLTAFTRLLTPLVPFWELLTLQHFEQLTTSSLFRRSIVNSVVLSTVGALLATAFVAAATLVAHRSRFRLRSTMQYLLLYPRAVPGIIIGMGFFWAFVVLRPIASLRTTIWGIMIAFAVRNMALGYGAVYPAVAGVGAELDQAARSCGANWWRSVRSTVLPLIRPALFASFVLLFVTMLNDYDPAVFLVAPGTEIMGLTMLQQWLFGVTGPVAALGIVQMVVTIVVISIGYRLAGRDLRA